MSTPETLALGRKGEQLACDFLTERGHQLLARNYRNGRYELDVISLDANGLHFVEVKDRKDADYLDGCITAKKQKNMVAAAHRYIASHAHLSGLDYYFDVIMIVDGQSIDYYPQAFIPIYL
ncbi:MAG: YraN family protein [Bacteroidales bacterium]|nr:YraN family protein [Bacteroidales bacterium]